VSAERLAEVPDHGSAPSSRTPLLDPPALVGPARQVPAVRHVHQRAALLADQGEQQVHDPAAVVVVEVARRLVGEQDPRAAQQGAADRHTLHLPPESLSTASPARPSRPTRPSSSRARAREAASRAPRSPAIIAGNTDVVLHGEVRQQVEELEHEADGVAPEPGALVLAHAGEVVTVDPDRPEVGASIPAARCRKVDFPDPLRPMIATTRPCGTSQVASRRACSTPRPPTGSSSKTSWKVRAAGVTRGMLARPLNAHVLGPPPGMTFGRQSLESRFRSHLPGGPMDRCRSQGTVPLGSAVSP